MRLAVCALSAVLLSGCSWLGDFGSSNSGYVYNQGGGIYQPQKAASQQSQAYGGYQQSQPQTYGGFPQQPDFNGGYTSGGYGSHVSTAAQQAGNYSSKPRIKKPKLRGTLSMGFEKSNGGNYIDYAKVPTLNPELAYNPTTYNETITGLAPTDGVQTSTTYSALIENIDKPDISFDDVHSTPLHIQGGLEYILSPHVTLFANAGYAYAEGEEGDVIKVNGALTSAVTEQTYVGGAAVGAPITNTTVIPNAGQIATFSYNFSDMERLDAEVGGRYYFNPIVKDQAHRTVTPFIGASAGIAHHNAQSLTVGQRQAFYQENYDALTGTPATDYQLTTYSVPTAAAPTQVYDSGIVPKGSLTAGMEWQVTKGTALALETGLVYEGGRDYSNGAKGDSNLSVPLTLRGSFNF